MKKPLALCIRCADALEDKHNDEQTFKTWQAVCHWANRYCQADDKWTTDEIKDLLDSKGIAHWLMIDAVSKPPPTVDERINALHERCDELEKRIGDWSQQYEKVVARGNQLTDVMNTMERVATEYRKFRDGLNIMIVWMERCHNKVRVDGDVDFERAIDQVSRLKMEKKG